jgi:hypothetical protein
VRSDGQQFCCTLLPPVSLVVGPPQPILLDLHNMTKKRRPPSELQKKAQKGFRGYPTATIAFYGPDDKFASKVAVGIIPDESEEVTSLERWFSESIDIRDNRSVILEIIKFIREHNVKSVVMPDRIIGCPHEEGIDYPEGDSCPHCPFWQGRDRWTGEIIQ